MSIKPIRITTKVTIEALRLIRLITAITGEKKYLMIERILRTEWERVNLAHKPDYKGPVGQDL